MSQTKIVPPARPDTRDAGLDRLLHPGRFYRHPDHVLRDETLSISEKRAILSSWASDACAVESCPPLRRPPFTSQPVTFDEIMEALSSLDRGVPGTDEVHAYGAMSRGSALSG